jgi:exopolyphosphatase/guanosine-5'-triphosphate,3'-diphosphate pyrophosphatase
VRCACIDIGSNTTRLLVGDVTGGRLDTVEQLRSFTRIGSGMPPREAIAAAKIDELAAVVREQLGRARDLGATEVRAVATAALRRAANAAEVTAAIRKCCGLEVEVLPAAEEARLAFLGAARMHEHTLGGRIGVVDVGGGSCELVVGNAPDRIDWSCSVELGSGELSERCLHSDPPSNPELAAARAHVERVFRELSAPRPDHAIAVGGSATSLRRLAGPLLDTAAFARCFTLLGSLHAAELSQRFGLDLARVRLMAAGLLILEAAAECFRAPLEVGRGGLREGVLLQLGHGAAG